MHKTLPEWSLRFPEVRHVVNVQLYDMANRDVRDPSGWEEGLGESEIILGS